MVHNTKSAREPSSSDTLSITLEPPSSCSQSTDWMVVSCEDRHESEDDSEILALRAHPQLIALKPSSGDTLAWREENTPDIGALPTHPQLTALKPSSGDTLAGREENTPEIKALRVHPQLANRYRILRTIGRGAQGTVYEARDLHTGEIAAIKALSFREIADWKASELFMREIALLKSMQIEGTPRYIEAIDATASSQPYYFLVQEFISGKTLQDMLDEGKKFSTQEVIAIALALIPILEKLRRYSPPIVHRDIKPSNIMMTPQGDIYLIDFGAAMFSERRTGGSTFAGTAGYMAPEQCMGTSTPDSDVYGLGATLIHLLTGIAPYKMQMLERSEIVQDKKKTKNTPSFPSSMTLRFKPHLPEETPQWLVELLEVMVSPYPNQRVKNLNRLVHAIRTIGGVELNGHSVHMDAAAHLKSMETMTYQPAIPDSTLYCLFAAGIYLGISSIFRQYILTYESSQYATFLTFLTLFLILFFCIFFLTIHRIHLFKMAIDEQHDELLKPFWGTTPPKSSSNQSDPDP
ncbi:MAG: serine/threonine protein kinase [Proteobacteria bacterium]|nr:serine/threonine protein kinase [Pseudomonadota bacterium]